jgi:hypothetical protein
MVFPQCDCRWLDSFSEPKNDKFSLYFGGRFTATKGGEKSVEQYLKMLMAGRDVEIYVTAVGGYRRLSDLLRHYGAKEAVHLFANLNFEMANRIQKKCHAAVFYQLNPGAGAPYYWLYNGMVVLMKRYGFPEEEAQMPPDYPFWFSGDAECATMLRWVHDNYGEAQARLAGVREWIRANVDERDGYMRLLEIGERKFAEHYAAHPERGRYDEDTKALAGRCLEALGDGVPFPLLLEAMEETAGRRVIQTDWGGGPALCVADADLPASDPAGLGG